MIRLFLLILAAVVRPPRLRNEGPAFRTSPGANLPPRRIVIHSTVSPCEEGGARRVAAYFRSSAARGSAHTIIDPGEAVQVVPDKVIAWHAPPNPRSIGNEMCDIPGPVPNDPPGSAARKAARRAWRWARPAQMRMLNRTARLTARQCLAYGVPIQWVGVKGLREGKEGITSHANVSKAWGQSTHWDPGWWPRRWFMLRVKMHARRIRRNEADQ
jgi:hypothetical protein